MYNNRFGEYLLLVVALGFLVALASPPTGQPSIPTRQSIAEWPDQRLLFVADERMGRVRSFLVGNGAPVPYAVSESGARRSVRDLQLDVASGQLWVLGDDGITIYAARDLKPLRHIALDTGRVERLARNGGDIVLLAAGGEQVGRIAAEG